MKFSENWLRDLVPTDIDRDALVQRLTMAGLEVDGVEVLGEALDGVVVGEIVAAEKHPQADRLQVCQVDAGADEPLEIVCGAPNARVGLKAPLAMIGARLPNSMAIKKAKLRGVESFGMLCSARELGIGADSSGLMELPDNAATGEPLASCLGFPDASIELGLTPNRGDCLGMWGLARDVAAILAVPTRLPDVEPVALDSEATRGIELAAGADCSRYAGRVVEGIDAAATTPIWIAERLRRAGLRPVSALVDVTNYVMLETGQPLHAFDNDTLEGNITVRHARADESLTLLDGTEATLDADFMVIADAGQALAVAGVMGDMASRVTDATLDVFLEAAHFAPAAIMGKARRLGLHTDASHRFERGVDPAMPVPALEWATRLLLELAGGRAGPISVAEDVDAFPAPAPVRLRRTRLSRVLGLDIADAEVERILRALDMRVTTNDEGWQAIPPTRRFDIAREEDLIEEVARVNGYERIPTRPPAGELALIVQPETRRQSLDVARQLAARDYDETVSMAFIGADVLAAWGRDGEGVPLANPLTTDMAVMRPSLLPGLIAALNYNLARQQVRVRLFERGHVFAVPAEPGAAPQETAHVAWVACGSADAEQWGIAPRALDFHDLRGDLDALIAATGMPEQWQLLPDHLPHWLHPGRGARVLRGGRAVGVIGMLHPERLAALDLDRDVYVAELDLDAVCARQLPRATPISRFPVVRRDIAVDLPEEVPWAKVAAAIRHCLGSRLHTLRVFDQYQGEGVNEGRKSLAIGLILQDASRTLTDDDANQCVADAVAALERDFLARLRG
jgi:phenylalanyl-tRNA synthetase beta chain